MLRGFGVTREMSLLDVGCGSGQLSQLTDGEYLGIDMDSRYITSARQRYGGAQKQFTCGRVQDLAGGERRFDVVLMADVAHHLSTHDLRELLMTLKKITGRWLVVLDPVQQSPRNYCGRFLTGRDRGKYIRSKEELLAILGETFTVLRVKEETVFFTEGIAVIAQPK